jgi:hypothetical protein
VIKVRLTGQFATAVNWCNLDYWRYNGTPPTVTQLNNLASAISSAWNLHLAPNFANDTSLTNTECIDLSSPTAAVGADGSIHFGTAGALDLPDTVCVLESKQGALKYRGGHSRTYWPGLGAAGSNATGNAWSTTAIQTWATALSAYLNQIISHGDSDTYGPIQRSIVHYHGKHPELTYPYVEDVIASNTSTAMATQRRRFGR